MLTRGHPLVFSCLISDYKKLPTEEIALAEAQRCLNCKNKPCVQGCPVNVNIPDFIMKAKEGDWEGAYKIINETSTLPTERHWQTSTWLAVRMAEDQDAANRPKGQSAQVGSRGQTRGHFT